MNLKHKKHKGFKIMAAAFLVAACGALIVFLGEIKIGRVIVIIGMLAGVIGMAMHSVEFFKRMKN